ncbi:MAG TPA: DUF2752 domain-containing protein [Bacteroidia bacterium]|nr:DUF2752 domain-containing protein [Bacteroidia bacterium]
MLKTPSYLFISWVFFILIGMVFGYSYLFYPNKHPIDCVIKERTGKDCPSCGFSRSFSHYTHFEWKEGIASNPLSLPVFIYFLLQFLFRFILILNYRIRIFEIHSKFIKTDILISISGFLFAFLPLLFNL